MNNKEKSKLTSFNRIKNFSNVMQKLTLDQELNYNESSFILSCALVLLQEFEKDNRLKSYLEFAYYIILKHSSNTEDYSALYNFAINFGFYPIANYISSNELLEQNGINDFLTNLQVEQYKFNGYIETSEQKKIRLSILDSQANEMSYVAPTSYGKSSIILEHIQINLLKNKRVGIIVPTKSLLAQTYHMIRDAKLNCRILIHDEMYEGDKQFIGIFTQERALRVLENQDAYFDILYIDEAHNIFKKDARNILLSRLIRKNKIRNPQQKVVYLSPLIANSDNLKFNIDQNIVEQRIKFNIKEAEVYEYSLQGNITKYNRFLNLHYTHGYCKDFLTYIKQNSTAKSFIYLRSPRKIEELAKELFESESDSDSDSEYTLQNLVQLTSTIAALKMYVHKDFYVIKLLEKGIIYLHGKLPNSIKEYLEYKFRQISEIKVVVANSVILEGINLPIDTLFILNTYDLHEKELTNLIGRVNRLDKVFSTENRGLQKLLPQIHFVNTVYYNKKDSSMTNKINSLRSRAFIDKVENPMLTSFDFDKLKINQASQKVQRKEFEEIVKCEKIVLSDDSGENNVLKKKLIEMDLNHIFTISEEAIKHIKLNIKKFKGKEQWNDFHIIDKIYYIFLKDIPGIKDFEFSRLDNEKARNYYKMFLKSNRTKSLKRNIMAQYMYFKQAVEENDSQFYIGESYGELIKESENYSDSWRKVYVDLSTKTDEEMINLAIVKLKLEDDFVSFKINKFIKLLHDLELISQTEYNLAVYGTNDPKKLKLIKMGLTFNIILKLEKDKQLGNIYLDQNNNLFGNDLFAQYKETLDDYFRFEINKLL